MIEKHIIVHDAQHLAVVQRSDKQITELCDAFKEVDMKDIFLELEDEIHVEDPDYMPYDPTNYNSNVLRKVIV